MVAQKGQEKAEPRLLHHPCAMFIESGNDPFKSPAFLGQNGVRDGLRVEARDLPPIGPRRLQQAVADLTHVAPSPKSAGILGVCPREFRFLTYPCAAESQGSRDGAGPGPVHAKHQKRRAGTPLVEAPLNCIGDTHINHS